MKMTRKLIITIAALVVGTTTVLAGPPHANMHGDAAMQKHMQEMRQTMKKIHETKDADKRMQLMHEHMTEMGAAMEQMQANDTGQEVDPARAAHMHKHAQGMMKQMMEHMKAQQQEINRLHDHSKMKR